MPRKDKKLRRAKFLAHELSNTLMITRYTIINSDVPSGFIARVDYLCNYYREIIKDCNGKIYGGEFGVRVKLTFEFEKLIKELKLTDEEVGDMVIEAIKKKSDFQEKLRINTLKETRDNKQTYNRGNSYSSNANKIRYPSLKRSKATWKRFYKLFPNAQRRKEV